jgi:uncharacterized damage-inducible protein DinB
MRPEPANAGPELAALSGFLDWQRETILLKADGLDGEQLGRRLPPSSLTLAGLLNHLAKVEDTWFGVRFAGLPRDPLWADVDWDADPDHDFDSATEVDPDELRRRYRDACARSREVVAAAASLDQRSAAAARDGQHRDLRWILIHMIEETARHAGHADLLREAIDGTTGE